MEIIFILTDDTIRSIALIQFAHKKTDKDFNDIVAQLYEQEFKTQEKAKYEHIRQAKEKSLEKQRISEENQRKEAIDNARERDREKSAVQDDNDSQDTDNSNAGLQIEEAPQSDTSSVIGNDWSQVSPEIAASYMSSKTGVSSSKWLDVIYKESSGNPYVTNLIGCYGLLQINQNSHGNVSGMTPQEYLDKAVEIYQNSGAGAWETW